MLYSLLKLPVRLALRIFCRKIEIPDTEALKLNGPLLIVANHPNSFLDAVIITAMFKKPVYSLARGDAFRKPWHNTLLRMLKMIPVYRLTEGKENLSRNDDAFVHCRQILERGEIVLIFIEGISINSHELQPFKKGAARIAIQNSHLAELEILPLAINYDSLNRFGKTISIETTSPIPVQSLLPFDDDAKNMRYFNEALFERLGGLIKQVSAPSKNALLQYLLFLPALIGYVLHFPLYAGIKKIVKGKTRGSIFYDSVLFAALFIGYPVYLVLMVLLLLLLNCSWLVIGIVIVTHPLLAWATVCNFIRKKVS